MRHSLAIIAPARPWRRQRLCFLAAGLAGLWAILPLIVGRRVIVINTSPSEAPGLYVRSAVAPAVGQLVDFRIPKNAMPYIHHRTGRGGERWYILKPIAAGPGEQVDTAGSSLVIDGRMIAPMPPDRDGTGAPLPLWRERRVLEPDGFFVFSARISNSFDSRCYGPIRRKEIDAVRRAFFTWR